MQFSVHEKVTDFWGNDLGGSTTVYCLLFAVTHAPFHVSSAEAYSWPSARDRRDREVNYAALLSLFLMRRV